MGRRPDGRGAVIHARPRAQRDAVLGASEITNHAETPLVRPRVSLLRAGTRAIATAVLLPEDRTAWTPPRSRCSSIRTGGPPAQLVLSARSTYPTSQWFADQGFAVVVADGRGTPGRGSEWSGPSTSTSPLRCSRTRSTPSGLRPPSIRNSTCPAGHPRVELRRLPRRPGDPPSAGRVPRRHRWGSRGRLAAVRHALHGALPRHAAGRARRLRPHVARRRGRTSAGGGTARASSS